jgi:DeoR/GlpR family transcriptional regulator of sugar metabolism
MSTVERTWIQKRSAIAVAHKRNLAKYAASHLVSHGDVIFVGSGTSLTALMSEVTARQAAGEKLDLQVVTSNLQVIAMGRGTGLNGQLKDARKEQEESRFLEAFKATQIVLTGGEVNSSLDSLTGDHAAHGINDALFHPTTVFFGARGLSFRGGLTISYQFLDEVSAQVAYATRPTKRRVLICDHTKLGHTEGRQAPLRLESLLEHARECIVLSTLPDSPDETDRVMGEVQAFADMCQELVSREQCLDKELALWMINGAGERRVLASLASIRQRAKGRRLRRSQATQAAPIGPRRRPAPDAINSLETPQAPDS